MNMKSFVITIIAALFATNAFAVEIPKRAQKKILAAAPELAQLRKMIESPDAEKDSLVGDPLFVDFASGDLSFKSGSPALKLGIEPMPRDVVGKIGTSKDPFINRYTETISLLGKSDTSTKGKKHDEKD